MFPQEIIILQCASEAFGSLMLRFIHTEVCTLGPPPPQNFEITKMYFMKLKLLWTFNSVLAHYDQPFKFTYLIKGLWLPFQKCCDLSC
jgi:hypothetical protein